MKIWFMTYNVILFSSPAMYPCTFIKDIYIHIYTYYMIGAWLNMAILTRIYGKKQGFYHGFYYHSGNYKDHIGPWRFDRRYLFGFFSLTVGVKSWNGRTNAKQLNFTIRKDPESKWRKSNQESKIQSDLITQNKCLIGKQTTNLPGFAINEPFIPSLVHIKDFTTGAMFMEFTSSSPIWHHVSWGRFKNGRKR